MIITALILLGLAADIGHFVGEWTIKDIWGEDYL